MLFFIYHLNLVYKYERNVRVSCVRKRETSNGPVLYVGSLRVQPVLCITIAPVSVDRSKIYDCECYGCKRPQRGMKSKTPLKTRTSSEV